MLKSTHKPQPAIGPDQTPLLPGWTEHKAPTGHSYYYNEETKKSTYVRPVAESVATFLPESVPSNLGQAFAAAPQFSPFPNATPGSALQNGQSTNTFNRRGFGHRSQQDRRMPQDRPKSKQDIPGCAPWLLVKTKLGRRFVHNAETGDSLWKFPAEVMKHVIEMDRKEREKRERRERGEASEDEEITNAEPEETVAAKSRADGGTGRGQNQGDDAEDSEEYEEVEVTDDEAEEDGDGDESSKRRKTEGVADDDQPIEFDEDDIAYQLQAMGQDYGLDPGEYGDGEGQDWEEGAEGLPLTEEDSTGLFKDMLDDHHINPYTTWERVIEDGRIIEDDRYTALTSMKARKEVYSDWSRERIQSLKEHREREEKKDPRIPYMVFLQNFATPKLYWPEFKRKYKKEPEMKNSQITDKDREKWYREHINRLKMPQSTLKSDLTALLKSLPTSVLNRSSSLAALPPQMLIDTRYISLSPPVRDPLIEAYITTLPPAPDPTDLSAQDKEEMAKKQNEREKREAALRNREEKVKEEKRRQEKELRLGKGRLQEEEQELQRAMKVSKEGLKSQLEGLD
ncbi:MAG: hypothetical protein M1821_003883 [Bathelium mastoideum]|nr:MAG: hypothetical protein M1821_003883 [Bathelium mastoideum]KAI9690960.1 MAG: hypothetical protein M1822_008580 [Bathelium mastoideum]